jgi:hypothetical protein
VFILIAGRTRPREARCWPDDGEVAGGDSFFVISVRGDRAWYDS